MGKKGKNKNQTINAENVVKVENVQVSEEKKVVEPVAPVVVPKEEPKIEPKVEEIKAEPEKIENAAEENEGNEEMSKSKKRRNRKKKNTATEIQAEEPAKENATQKVETAPAKIEDEVKPEPINDNDEKPADGSTTDTLKKKRRRNKKKNASNVDATQEDEEQKEETPELDKQNVTSGEKSGEETATSQSNTLKKRKRNKNKNKNAENSTQNDPIPEQEQVVEQKQIDPAAMPASVETNRNEPQRRSKKGKREKKTILDELQERQQREQKEAREHIQNEIAKREKLLETIDLVLDCHKSEVELAKSQQESIKDVKKLTTEAAKAQSQPAPPKPAANNNNNNNNKKGKKSSPVEEQLVNKIEQVLGMTKLEIQNAQAQQAYVNRLEAEVAKVKQSKDILLGEKSSPVVPPHIQKMATEMRDLTKGEVPKTKEEIVKEIETRDALMAEINRVLDTTKTEIDKVQKQQKIIKNLEVELNKMKEQEIVEKIVALAEEGPGEEPVEPPPPPKQSAATASLLDALMANVGKLKEIQAQKEKEKAEKEAEKPKVEEKQSQPPVEAAQEVREKSKSPPKSSPESNKKHQKDQKKQPQKKQDVKPVDEEKKIIVEEKKEEIVPKKVETKVESSKIVEPQVEKKIEAKEPSKSEPVKEAAPKTECKKESKAAEPVKQEEVPKVEPKKVSQNQEPKKVEPVKPEPKKVEPEKPEPKSVEPAKVEPKKEEIAPKPEETKPAPAKQEKKPASPKDNKKKNDQKGKNVEQVKPQEVKKEIEPKKEEKPVEVPPKVEEKKVEAEVKPAPIEIKSAPVEVKPITNSEPKEPQAESPKVKNEKGHKGSPKNSHKNRHHKHDKKDVPKGVPQVVDPPEISSQKPSMAEMLKNAPDPPPDEEVEIKPSEEEKAAPLARPESAIIEVKPSELIKETASKEEKPAVEAPKEVEKIEEAPKVETPPVVAEAKLDESIVIVDKEQVEKEMKQEQEEKESTDPKNVQGSGFVSPAKSNNNNKEQEKDAKPLKKDGKQPVNKSRSPVKAPSKPAPQQKPATAAKPAIPPKPNVPKPKLDVQARVNSKPEPRRSSLQSGSPTKPSSPITEKSQPKFENTNEPSPPAPSQASPTSTEKPKIPPRPDVTKTKPANRAGNVTNPPPSVKPKTPSPSKPPSSNTTATTPKPANTAQSSAQGTTTTKPKQPQQSPKKPPPQNTKNTNQKPLATQQQKTNSTKPTTTKSPATFDSVFRLRQVTSRNNHNSTHNKIIKKSFSQPSAFRIIRKRMDGESIGRPDIINVSNKRPLTTPIISPDNNKTNQMKAILTQDGIIKIILPSTVTGNLHDDKFLSKDDTGTSDDTSITRETAIEIRKASENDDSDEDDQYAEYKMTPRQIFCASICQVCKVNLSRYFLCHECKMVAYCKEEHMKIDYLNHKGLCMAIQLIAKRRGGHVYNMAKHLSSLEFRNLRLHTIYLCEQFLNRTLLTFEREIFLFPRLCHEAACREWKSSLLSDCEKCGLVSFCALHPLSENHKKTCSSFALFQRIILHEKSYGRIDVALPQKVLRKIPTLTDDLQDTMRLLYKNTTAFQDECVNAALMQIASAPLTTFYAYQKLGLEFKEQMTIQFVGAELKFEGDRLEKWESFFLHLAHGISDLEIVLIGSELNHENLPVEIISRKRMCKMCRQNCCGIRYDFQCKKFYHDYCESAAYVKPDFVCFFNPAIYRPGFRGFDTWPKTIEAALKTNVPVLVTATTEDECYMDLKRIKKITNDDIIILVPPIKNPYSSTRPERNFASDDEDPIMFKNNFLFIVGKTPDLIEF